jgi:5-hydroxyisourate hydrolase
MSAITTHVLDTSLGKPALGVCVVVESLREDNRWVERARGVTDANGRIGQFDPPVEAIEPGQFRLRFATGDYFLAAGTSGFYPEVCVIVQIDDPAQHYHIPLLLSPYGYSTYRGN